MKGIIVLSLALLFMIAGTGCVSSSITVLEKKYEPTRPFGKVLLVYIDEGCDFSVFDSTTYNICMRSNFMNPDNMELRKSVEDKIVHDMSSAGTTILKSSASLNVRTNSYNDFVHLIDQQAIEAILLVDFHRYSRTENESQPMGSYQKGEYIPNRPMHYKTLNAAYECYLINPKNVAVPYWRAEIGLRGKIGAGKSGLNSGMAHQLAQTLQSNGYIAH